MRAKNILHRTLSVGLIALWAGCAGGRPSLKRDAYADPCTDDMDCDTRFCDNGYCIPFADVGPYGGFCKPPDKNLRPDEACPNGYLCLDGRCRSCRSDDECTAYFGTGKCVVVNEPTRQRGYACFPDTTRRFPEAACEKDEQCRSGFCDRGRCARIEEMDAMTHGLACVPGPVPEVDRYGGFERVKECKGYLCIEQRCRSCVSDEECQRSGAQNVKCVALTQLPGKLCATPEMQASPQLNWGNLPHAR